MCVLHAMHACVTWAASLHVCYLVTLGDQKEKNKKLRDELDAAFSEIQNL